MLLDLHLEGSFHFLWKTKVRSGRAMTGLGLIRITSRHCLGQDGSKVNGEEGSHSSATLLFLLGALQKWFLVAVRSVSKAFPSSFHVDGFFLSLMSQMLNVPSSDRSVCVTQPKGIFSKTFSHITLFHLFHNTYQYLKLYFYLFTLCYCDGLNVCVSP